MGRLFLTVPFFLDCLLLWPAFCACIEESGATANVMPAEFGQSPANSNSPTEEKQQAIALINAGRFKEAIDRLQSLNKIYRSDTSIQIALVNAYLKAGMSSEGEKEAEGLLSSSTLSEADGLALAKVLIAERQRDAAQKVLAEVAARWPEKAQAHAELGLLLSAKSQFEQAVWQLGRAVQLRPDSTEYVQALAEVLLSWRHYSTALDFVGAEEERFGKVRDLDYCRAFALYGLRRHEEALAILHQLLEEYPRFDRAYYLSGTCYLDLGDAQKAAASFKKAIEINPRNPSSYISLAEVLRRNSHKIDQAISYARKGLALDPTSSDGRVQLALCYESKREYSRAQSLLEEVTQEYPDLIPPHRILARVYYQEGDFSKADHETKIAATLEADHQKPAPESATLPHIDPN